MQNPSPMPLDDIALSLHKKVGHRTIEHLLTVFGDSSKIYAATYNDLIELAELKPSVAKDIAGKTMHSQAESELEYCRNNGITPVGLSSDHYPPLLRECCDRPMVLYVMGNTETLTGDMLAVVGTRKITGYGKTACEQLVGGLAGEGYRITIVSGLAYGVDAQAHRCALGGGLNTVAVLGNRLPRIYPPENSNMARSIIDNGGCLVSELHSQSFEGRMTFVARNRIIAGMSLGTLIVESPLKGGSMITAEMAAGYDRTVMAVPGRINDGSSAGTNYLVRKLRAVSVSGPGDIAEELNLDIGSRFRIKGSDAVADDLPPLEFHGEGPDAEDKMRILRLIVENENAGVDLLSDRTDIPAHHLLALLFEMELSGQVKKTPGGTYITNTR